MFGEIKIDLNAKPPRRNTFECTLIKKDGTEVLVWTGLDKGPPRKLKFPEPSIVVKAIQDAL